MTDLRAVFNLTVNIISTDDLNNFVTAEKPYEPRQGFWYIKTIQFHLNHNPQYRLKMSAIKRLP